MKEKFRHQFVVLLTNIVVFFSATFSFAAELVWLESKQAAVNLAQQQGKMVLLMAGRLT
jgi:hypothetical protein